MKFSVDWMHGWANSPNFVVEGIDVPAWPGADEHVWEQRDGLHRADVGPSTFYFWNDMSGQPTEGFGGRVFEGRYLDGRPFRFVGAWSSRAGCVNSRWPDRRIADVHYLETNGAGAVAAEALIGWWRAHRQQVDWGLAWVYESGDILLLPTREGKLKESTIPQTVLEVLQ
jgi:hypothetical protein